VEDLSGVVLARFWVDAIVDFVSGTKTEWLWARIALGIFGWVALSQLHPVD
jgi:hypothetical protein